MNKTLDQIDHNIAAMQKYIAEQLGSIQEKLTSQLAASKVAELEVQLAEALNPFSSRLGPVVNIKDGKLFYRVNGSFVPYEDIVEALRQAGHRSVVTPPGGKTWEPLEGEKS